MTVRAVVILGIFGSYFGDRGIGDGTRLGCRQTVGAPEKGEGPLRLRYLAMIKGSRGELFKLQGRDSACAPPNQASWSLLLLGVVVAGYSAF